MNSGGVEKKKLLRSCGAVAYFDFSMSMNSLDAGNEVRARVCVSICVKEFGVFPLFFNDSCLCVCH